MKQLVDLKHYKQQKKAKAVLKDLKAFSDVLFITNGNVKPFGKYAPAKTLLRTIQEINQVTNTFIKKLEKIIEND